MALTPGVSCLPLVFRRLPVADVMMTCERGPDYDPAAYLAETSCPRCGVLGLVVATEEELEAAKPEDRRMMNEVMCPAPPIGRCPACGLVGNAM